MSYELMNYELNGSTFGWLFHCSIVTLRLLPRWKSGFTIKWFRDAM